MSELFNKCLMGQVWLGVFLIENHLKKYVMLGKPMKNPEEFVKKMDFTFNKFGDILSINGSEIDSMTLGTTFKKSKIKGDDGKMLKNIVDTRNRLFHGSIVEFKHPEITVYHKKKHHIINLINFDKELINALEVLKEKYQYYFEIKSSPDGPALISLR